MNTIGNTDTKFYTKDSYLYIFLKRVLDIIVSTIGLVLLSPLFLVLIVIMKLEDTKGPVFFVQQRLGQHGKVFKIYKFRSMRTDADEHLRKNKKLYKKYIENDYKLEQYEDPRITKLGAFLRKTSLDELPQLFNVVIGNMSLVGPRPIILEELTEYEKEGKVREFLSMKPGITGIWQTSGRSNIGYPDRVYLEISYIEKKSILKDLSIILKTFVKVFKREGAY